MYKVIIYGIIIILIIIYINNERIELFTNKNKVAVILQTHYLSDKLKENILKMKSDVEEEYDFWVLYDNTNNDFDIEWIKGNNIRNYIYKKEDCLKYYSEKVYNPYSGIYNSPAKPILPIFNIKYKYDYIWCIEYDVIYTGNWKDIINNYKEDKDDIITYINDKMQSYNWNHWNHCNICTLENRIQIFLPVIRYSEYMLDKIFTHLKKGYTGHHEAFIGTLCNTYKQCKIKELDKKFIGIYR